MSVLNKAWLVWQARRNLREVVRHSRPSFSQYGEDLIVDKLLHPRDKGTYVDVGANHPINGSNTFRLYLRGWNGLAIDPNPRFAQDFKSYRPRDRYLTEGVSLTNDSLTYHVFEKDVFNTFDVSTVNNLLGEGVKRISKIEVYCRPLSVIVDQYL